MSLSLVPEYASSESGSDSELDGEKSNAEKVSARMTTTTESTPAIPPASRELGAKLASVLPPPKHRATTDSNKVQIVADFGRPDQTQIGSGGSEASSSLVTPATKPSDSSAKRQAGGLFSELLNILPAPKNSRFGTSAVAKATSVSSSVNVDRDEAKPVPVSTPALQSLIPHSISSKRRGKMAATSTLTKGKAAVKVATRGDNADADSGSEPDAADDVVAEAKPAVSGSGPFFTIGAAEARADELSESEGACVVDLSADNSGTGQTQPQSAGSELHYDPNSGYYYSYANERYYYYDAENGEYVDTQTLYPEDQGEHEPREQGTTDHSSTVSRIDPSDLQRLIGRGALKRGEMQEMATAAIKNVSLAAQLHNSGYSDMRMAAEFSAQRSAEQQRQDSKHIIVGDESDKKKKKSKNNIMYLALQAQEQEAKLKDAHANRQRAKKAARAKYGY
ncbi:hypothetical protein GGH94_001289 [Coemansia aciculifera]|uniref:OCRE domain-containing protein n=1 Tax=Coemansia aciculifera TaxID=417176 RepID=A0A9W8IL11_9FUNG|nr:hypothetical protein GGH94_001289 [Coemansia aciculifera]